jgi:hypothetical protein
MLPVRYWVTDTDICFLFLGRFYHAVADYYWVRSDISSAQKLCETAISLAHSTGNTKMHSVGLQTLAWIKHYLGDDSAQAHAQEAQRLARISGDLYREAEALEIKAMCCHPSGNFKQCMSLSTRARELLGLCGMSGGILDHNLMSFQAEIHKLKSEFIEAHNIHAIILQETSVDQDPYNYAFSLLYIAEIGVHIGASKDDIQRNLATARTLLSTKGNPRGVTLCDTLLADLLLREGNMLASKILFEKCIKSSFGHSEAISYCLERLGNTNRWGAPNLMSNWTAVFLVHCVKLKDKLGVHKALKFLGDIFLAQDDEHTAISLFTVALDGFTHMGVHCSRAESMLQLGDISKANDNLFQAVELWEAERALFERSSQTEQIKHVDERLISVSEKCAEAT